MTGRSMEVSADGQTDARRIAAFDGLRAIGVVLVMAYHADLPGFAGGKVGVDLFFVLSGFLITRLLLAEQANSGHIALGRFYLRRGLRLYPALLAAVILALALAALKVPVFDASSASFEATLGGTPYVLFYTMNVARAAGWSSGGYLGHTWSLAIEEQFYFVWPLLLGAVFSFGRRARTLMIVALGCAVTSAALRAGLQLRGWDEETLYNATFSHVDGIFLGCALAVVAERTSGRILCKQPIVVGLFTLALGAIVVRGESMNTYGIAVSVLAAGVAIAHIVSAPGSYVSRALSTPVLIWIGKRSYGLYLYHWPIFLFVGISHRPEKIFIATSASFVVATLSFRYVEQPFLRLKDTLWRGRVKVPRGL